MPNQLNAKEYNLFELLSGKFIFNVPDYQRPYSWTENEALTLWDDLINFWKSGEENVADTYFTGSIVLVYSAESPEAEVIDGQQRLTTLSMILSVLRNKSGALKSDIEKCLWQDGIAHMSIPGSPRLNLRERDRAFFENNIAHDGMKELMQIDPVHLDDDAQRLMQNNMKLICNCADELFGDDSKEVDSFITSIFKHCLFVVVSTADSESAFRVFSVLNNRGLSLLPSDIIKAHIIGGISTSKRDFFTNKWEDIEVELGRESFNALISHIRMRYAGTKLHAPLVEEFEKYTLNLGISNEDVIIKVIEPYAESYKAILQCQYQASQGADEVNELLMWLNRIDDSDWIPVCMLVLSLFSNNAEVISNFITLVERLASYMYITSKTSNQRIERYSKAIHKIDEKDIMGALETLELSQAEQHEFLEALNGDIYLLPARKRTYVVLRLDQFESDNAAEYKSKIFSIEHVLPQNPQHGSQWFVDWPDSEEREAWLHKIANLVPLTKKKNSQAQNYDFDKKKEKYFSSKAGVTTYALTVEVLNENKWTPETVRKRQLRIMEAFKQGWDLTDSDITAKKMSHEVVKGNKSTSNNAVTKELNRQQELQKLLMEFYNTHPNTMLPHLPEIDLGAIKYAKKALYELFNGRYKFSDKQIEILCSAEECKKYIHRNLGIIVPTELAFEKKVKERYWRKNTVIIGEKEYFVFSQWYEASQKGDAHKSDVMQLYLDIAQGIV